MASGLGPTRALKQVLDRFNRPLSSLRISVTDRCNMRCGYCMPEAEYAWLPRSSILSFEELDRLAGIFASVGVRKIRVTGGEPLLRHGLPDLVHRLALRPEVTDLALTTNGILLAAQAAPLRAAGLKRLTVSLDTLRPERMQSFARSAKHGDVLAGITAARDAGFPPIKFNSVVLPEPDGPMSARKSARGMSRLTPFRTSMRSLPRVKYLWTSRTRTSVSCSVIPSPSLLIRPVTRAVA